MRFFEWMGGTIAIAGVAMTVQVANAQQCAIWVQSGCLLETVEIVGSGGGSGGGYGGGGYNPHAGGGSIGGGGGTSAQPTTTAEWKVFFEKLIKLGGKACKKSDETCSAWGQRMISRGFGNSSICDVSGTIGAQYVQSACNLAINEETQLTDCANVVACPK